MATSVKNPFHILRTGDFDPSKLVISEATPTKYKSMQAYINYPNPENAAGKVYYQTPIMAAPFGVSESKMTEEDEPKYYLELQFDATNDNLEGFHKKTHDLFEKIDDKVVDVAVDNSATWFKKKKSKQVVIDEKYKSVLKRNHDKEGNLKTDYPDRLSFKILLDETKKPNVEVYNDRKERVNVNTIQDLMNVVHNGRRVKVIVQAASVWISSTGCGVSWYVRMIKLYEGEPQLPEYAFDEDSDDVEAL
jgi:hypothetical protein